MVDFALPILLLGATLLLAFAAVGAWWDQDSVRERMRLRERLDRLRQSGASASAEGEAARLSTGNPYTEFILDRLPGTTWLTTQIRYANVPLRADAMLLVILGCAAAAWFLTPQFGVGPLGRLASVPIGAALPVWELRRRARHRATRLTMQFPDALGLMVSSLRAGHSMQTAMDMVTEQMAAPVGTEFEQVGAEMNLGIGFNTALLNMINRVESYDLRLFVTAVLIQQEAGGNIVEMLQSIDETIRDRIRILGQVRTASAQGRLSAIVIGVMPFAVFLVLQVMVPGYSEDFLHDPRGRMMLGVAFTLWLLGFYLVNRIVSIRV